MHPPLARPRLLPGRPFPAYAYLPGRSPHPVRDPDGHSHGAAPEAVAAADALGSDVFRWGADLFNHGYYWEAHEAWEGLWQAARASPAHRMFFKGLILLAATGVKIREGKPGPALRHASRAATCLRRTPAALVPQFTDAIGMAASQLADLAEAATTRPPTSHSAATGEPQSVFDFVLAPAVPA